MSVKRIETCPVPGSPGAIPAGNPKSSFTPLSGVQCNARVPGHLCSEKPVLLSEAEMYKNWQIFPYIAGRHGIHSFLYQEAVKDYYEFLKIKTEFEEKTKESNVSEKVSKKVT